MKQMTRIEIFAVTLVLVLSLVLRVVGISTFVVSDEMRWTCRSLRFRDALVRGDWVNTFRIGHPGVITTWLGTLFLSRDDTEAIKACTPDALDFDEIGATPEERTQLMLALGQLLPGGRLGVALFTWLCLIGIYLLARSLWGAKIAVLSLTLIALDPFYLALSRILHTDAVLTGLMTLSILSLLASRRHSEASARNLAMLALSGVLGGMAVLQKSPAGFLIPFAILLLALDTLRQGINRERALHTARDLVIWGLVTIVVYVALWPAMWSDPVGTINKVLGKGIGYAVTGHAPGNYFLGQPVQDPGWLFYPIAIPFRLSPLVLVGFVIGLGWLARGRDRVKNRFGLGTLLLYSVLFGVFMTLGNKMFARYLLPIFPSLAIVAAAGLWWSVEAGIARVKSIKVNASSFAWLPAFLIALVTQVAITLPHYPYYLTYYNPLLGGGRQAQKVILVGWGEGYDLAAAYMNAKSDVRELEVAMPAFTIFAPQFQGKTTPMPMYRVWESDYILFYISHVQRRRYSAELENYLWNPDRQPEQVVSLHGVDYIWLYRNGHYVAPIDYIEEHSRPDTGECLVVNGDSLFAKYYQGDLPVYTVHVRPHPEKEGRTYWNLEDMTNLLDGLPSACRRIWYARYPEHEGGTYVELLNSRGVLMDEASFPHMELTLHRLVSPEITLQPLDLRFGDLRLQGYGLTDPLPAWGRDGGIVLEWEALRALEEDYSVFLHLYDAHGQRIAQGDNPIIDSYLRSTSYWEPGVAGSALYHLSIPPATPPGQYELEVGVYLLKTGERLPLVDSSGASQGKSVRLKVDVGSSGPYPALVDLNLPRLLERDLTPQLRLLGYELEHEVVLAGQGIPIRLAWQALETVPQDYQVQLELEGPDGTIYEQGVFDPVGTDYPTSRWQPGEMLQERYYLSTAEKVPTGEVSLMLNLLDEEGQPVLAQPAEVTRVWIQSTVPSFEAPSDIGKVYEVDLGDQITLLGYDLDSGPVKPGENVHVTLYWQAQREIEASYKVFVHVYDEEGNIVAQRDWLPELGVRLTVDWEVGEVVADRHTVPIDMGVSAGEYAVAVGMYEEGSGERLAAYGPDGGRLGQDRIFLGQVKIGP
jgi:4-amino-4-deoxy-L-arabinose transferase-like glycosyltransferase